MTIAATTAKGILIERQKAILQRALIDDIDPDDPTRARVVMVGGNYEGEPDVDRIVVQVLDLDPRRPEDWRSARKDEREDLGFEYPQFSGLIGGPKFHTERGVVKVTVNLDGNGTTVPAIDEDDAVQIRQTVMSRAAHALQTATNLVGFFDDYGVGVHEFQVSELPGYPLAGPNFEGIIRWAALVTVPRR